MDFGQKVQDVDSLIEKHEKFRRNCLNLIASENVPSPLVERLIVENLDRRYGNYAGIDLKKRSYQGNRFIAQIEELAHQYGKKLFNASYVDLRPLSGNIAGIAAVFGLGSPGDTVLEVHNGHRYAEKLATSNLRIDLKSVLIPWDSVKFNVDLDRTVSLIRELRPKLVILGSGRFLFPQPVRELKIEMQKYNPDSYLIYDAAHVLGLIAGKKFQDPLEEGADVVISSTHKTFAGPQGGLILMNEKSLAERIGPAIAPLLESNHHLSRLPALAGTFLEWMTYGKTHAKSIVENAQALGQALYDRNVPLVGEIKGFTESHTLLPIVDSFGESKAMADRLEACHIITGASDPPSELGTHGLRLGVQELTRRGMSKVDVPEIADCIVEGLSGKDIKNVKQKVVKLAKRFSQIRFTF